MGRDRKTMAGDGASPRADKDGGLDRLAERGNVAQFVSFEPSAGGVPRQRFSRVRGFARNHHFANLEEAVGVLMRAANGSINVRSYASDDPRGRDFVYGLVEEAAAAAVANALLGQGLTVILNETIDVRDGGVSGVAHGDIVEFAPDDTPRCVERPGTASLPRAWALPILETVYGFAPDLGDGKGRLEFSLHPARQGCRGGHTVAWEWEDAEPPGGWCGATWPNGFSRMLGDKAFGLLVAERVGLRVPATTVVGRRVRPFSFGSSTGSAEVWTRTCPREPDPGRFTTKKGWLDPFALLRDEDPGGEIASILCQAAVPAAFSGAAVVVGDGGLTVEGVAGEGDGLMVGAKAPERLPARIVEDVAAAHAEAVGALGPVRLEWVHDGAAAWIVQLHLGATRSLAKTIVPGEPERWTRFEAAAGLSALRDLLASFEAGRGLLLVGEVGLTSHLADVVRRKGVPARIVQA